MTIDVQAMLDGLGASPIEIANTLRNKGVTGMRSEQELCPIANYLRSQGVCNANVNAASIAWDEDDGEMMEWACSATITNFVVKFDEGLYPFLDYEDYDE